MTFVLIFVSRQQQQQSECQHPEQQQQPEQSEHRHGGQNNSPGGCSEAAGETCSALQSGREAGEEYDFREQSCSDQGKVG